jgi:hypothetical protein
MPHYQSLREVLAHLRRFPRVDIYMSLLVSSTRISALWRTRDRRGIHFDVYNGPACMIGAPLVLIIDGGDTEFETSIEFTDRGFLMHRGGDNQVEVVYRTGRPWTKHYVAS